MGMPAPIGTGIFKLMHQPENVDLEPKQESLLFEAAVS